jgi:hypothetical protein
MSIAWTSILIIALLLPGVFFFIGYATGDRYTREIVKSSAIGEIGWAVFISIVIHLLGWGIVAVCGFDLASNLKRDADFNNMPHWLLVDHLVGRILPVSLYLLATALAGLGAGCVASWGAINGYLPFLIKHKWINQVKLSLREGLVTAYVMTTLVENNRALMYKGILAEFYQDADGKFAYVVLKTCSRYFMTFEETSPRTGEQLQLFGATQAERQDRVWDFLHIDGKNIANILFDPSPQIVETNEGTAALDTALQEYLRQQATRTVIR